MSRLGAAVFLGLLSAIALGSGTYSPTASAQTLAACPADLQISVAPPTGAATTTVITTITPTLNLKAAAVGDVQSFHVHYYVDIDPTKTLKAGSIVPSGDPKIIHGAATTQDVGALAVGAHTVWVVVGQVAHQACGGTDGNVIVAAPRSTWRRRRQPRRRPSCSSQRRVRRRDVVAASPVRGSTRDAPVRR